MAVTIPPSRAIAVATLPTTPWSGAVCSRMVIEYDDAVADMPVSLSRRARYGQVAVVVVAGIGSCARGRAMPRPQAHDPDCDWLDCECRRGRRGRRAGGR